MPDKIKTYTVITVDNRQYHVAPKCAQMLEEVCQDENLQRMFAIPFNWLRLTVHGKRGGKDGAGGAVSVEVAGG